MRGSTRETGHANNPRTTGMLHQDKPVTWVHCPTCCMRSIQVTQYGARRTDHSKGHIRDVLVDRRVEQLWFLGDAGNLVSQACSHC